ncbi:hypothetical protein ACFYNL_38305 [Streptomyces sp. NPDC007808]|uniref:hypothetical protein n=1 Tax=Streptomyces sp. NPDC007808 TaxID=3364779 RepID=UPI0036D1AFC6
MNDEPSRLQLLRFARRVVVQQATAALAQIGGWIALEERREAEQRRGMEARPAPPDWLILHGLNPHLEGQRCPMSRSRGRRGSAVRRLDS